MLVHSMTGGPTVPRKDFELAENILAYEKNRLLEKKIPCVSILSVRGMDAGEDLVQLAEEKKVDEIIIGIKKRSKVEKLVFGSTAQYVILNAPCPVVSVK
jgi:nucleotide-binding universal stress UspA family protein